MIVLENPLYLWLLLFIPAAYSLYIFHLVWRKRIIKALGDPVMVNKLIHGYSAGRQHLKLLIVSGVTALLSIVLAGPKVENRHQVVETKGAKVIFVIDVSLSMLSEDVAPSRLEKAKYIISKAVEKLPDNQVAVVAFSGVAYPLIPLTSDHVSVQNALHAIKADMLPVPGSSLVEAVKMSIRFTTKDKSDFSYVFLMSDGEDHTANLATVVDSAADRRLKIFTLGIGTQSGSTIPTRDLNGKIVLKKDQNGEIVHTLLNEQALKAIASRTSGKYQHVLNTQDGVNFITSNVEEAESPEPASKSVQSYTHLFQWFLGAALILVLLDFFLA